MISLFLSRYSGDVFLGLSADEYSASQFNDWIYEHYLRDFQSTHWRVTSYFSRKTGIEKVEPHIARQYFKGLLSERERQLEDVGLFLVDDWEAYGNLKRSINVMLEYMNICDDFDDQWDRPTTEEFVVDDDSLDLNAAVYLLIANCYDFQEDVYSLKDSIESDQLEVVATVYSVHNSLLVALWSLYDQLLEERPDVTGLLKEVKDFSAFSSSLQKMGIMLEKFETSIPCSSNAPSKPNG